MARYLVSYPPTNPALPIRTRGLLLLTSPAIIYPPVDVDRDYANAQRAKEKRECTFRPALNPVTQSMGQAAPLDELVNNRRGQRVRDRAQAKAR